MEKDLALISVHKEQLLSSAGSWDANALACGLICGNCMDQWTILRCLLLVSQTTAQWKTLSSVNSFSQPGVLHDFTLSTCYWIRCTQNINLDIDVLWVNPCIAGCHSSFGAWWSSWHLSLSHLAAPQHLVLLSVDLLLKCHIKRILGRTGNIAIWSS